MNSNSKEIQDSIGKSIQYWRNVRGYLQSDLAEKIATYRSYIARIENGHVGISLKRIIEIADALEVSAISLIGGLPVEKEIRIVEDIYHDISLKITQAEHEMLWNLNIFKDDSITLENYLLILSTVRAAAE